MRVDIFRIQPEMCVNTEKINEYYLPANIRFFTSQNIILFDNFYVI